MVLATSGFGWWLGHHHGDVSTPWRATRVVDGGTIDVARGDRTDIIRLLGVNTPETHDPRKPVECFGPEASTFTTRELTGRLVRLEGDVESRDIYGRRLAYVLVDGQRFNDVLLRRGTPASS